MSPRFSVLLPTRNGGDFIADCIHSILAQDFPDFELIVSDNANEDATPRVLAGISDPRMTVLRQTNVIPVHENWGATLDAARGDYILMMGDDDYLMPGALSRLATVVAEGEPDCVLFNGYSYVAPNAIPGDEASYWSPDHFRYDTGFVPGEMARADRMAIVRDMFRFRQRIPLNMQTTLFSRRAAEKLPPPVFRAPFPDHYLLNAMLIAADRWIYRPERLVIVGVSPKSFGHYFYGQQSNQGLAYLGIETRESGLVPGNELLNGMYRWLLLLLRNYPDALKGTRVSRSAYLVRQVRFWLLQYRHGALARGELLARMRLLSAADWTSLLAAGFDVALWRRAVQSLGRGSVSRTQTLWPGLERLAGVGTIREFAAWLSDGRRSDESL